MVDAFAAPLDHGLDAVLGAPAATAVRETLRIRARRWALAVAADRAYEATSIAAAVAAVAGHDGPLLLAAPDVPGLDVGLAEVALADLGAGCELAVGLAHDARPYLVVLPRPDRELLDVVEAGFAGGVLGALGHGGRTIGLLRSERRLASVADARAIALDPLAPAELVAPLEALRRSFGLARARPR